MSKSVTHRILLLFLGLLVACDKPEQFVKMAEVEEKRIWDTVETSDSKIAIISHSTLDVPYLRLTIDNHRRYARKNNYDYIFRNNLISTRFIDEYAPKKAFQLGLYWQKIAALQEVMTEKVGDSQRYDWVLWVDADAVFTNFETTIESVLAEYATKTSENDTFFLASREPYHLINAGVLLFRNNDQSRKMLETIAEAFPLYAHQRLPEQEAIQDFIGGFLTKAGSNEFHVTPMMQRNYHEREGLFIPGVKVLTQRALNSFYKGWCPWACSEKEVWQPGDFIAHFAVVNDKNQEITDFVNCLKERGGENYQDGTAYKTCT